MFWYANYEKLAGDRPSEASTPIRARVTAARERQAKRFAANLKLRTNTDMGPAEEHEYSQLDPAGQSLMRQLQLSARAYHCVLKLTRTISDLTGSKSISRAHLGRS